MSMHAPGLIATVAVCFVLAFGLGYAADRLRLPPLVGYLVAGLCVGPFTPGFVADAGLSEQLAEVGIILLMFGVGLHFSSASLRAVQRIAIPGAVAQIVVVTLLGVLLAFAWGWSLGAGLVLGLSLAVASTVVMLKALEERNLIDTTAGRVAIGWLIVEDIAMVLVLVVLPLFATALGGHALASPSPAAGGSAASLALVIVLTLAKVALFAALAIGLGPRVLPWLLVRVARTGSRELFTLSVLALALGIAFGSAQIFGVSFALGAFFAGVVLSESNFSHRAASDSLPLQDAFSVLFFVSVGMMFDPSVLVRHPSEVFAVVLLIMAGKALVTLGLVRLMRYPSGLGLTLAAGVAQVGEFSFILIGLGSLLGLLPDEGRDLVLAGALVSIALNPLAFWAAGALQRRDATLPNAVPTFGAARLRALEVELDAVRKRDRDREAAKSLELRNLVGLFPILSRISRHEQDELLLMFRPQAVAPGTRILRKGDRAERMYFIASGSVQVDGPDGGTRLEAGAFFGALALINDARRIADVSTVDYSQFLVLERRDFNRFIARHAELQSVFRANAQERKPVTLFSSC